MSPRGERSDEEVKQSALILASVGLGLDITLLALLLWQLKKHISSTYHLSLVKKGIYAMVFLAVVFDMPKWVRTCVLDSPIFMNFLLCRGTASSCR